MNAPDVPISQALRLLRARLGVTQTELSQRGGPDYRTISHWETGRKYPSLKLLAQYLAVLECDFHDLQDALDQPLGEGPVGFRSRLEAVERRLSALEGG
ncbi:MAG: helix-turn-helix transcriptional regulator [Acidobacteriota bacterium]